MSKFASANRSAKIAMIQMARKQVNLPDDRHERLRLRGYFQRLDQRAKTKLAGSSRRLQRSTAYLDALPLVRRIRA